MMAVTVSVGVDASTPESTVTVWACETLAEMLGVVGETIPG
jgi:hypothetical protein